MSLASLKSQIARRHTIGRRPRIKRRAAHTERRTRNTQYAVRNTVLNLLLFSLAVSACSTEEPTATPTLTATLTATSTATHTPPSTATHTPTATATATHTSTPTATPTLTVTPTSTATATPTSTPTHTATPTSSPTPTPSPTPTLIQRLPPTSTPTPIYVLPTATPDAESRVQLVLILSAESDIPGASQTFDAVRRRGLRTVSFVSPQAHPDFVRLSIADGHLPGLLLCEGQDPAAQVAEWEALLTRIQGMITHRLATAEDEPAIGVLEGLGYIVVR